MASSSDHGGCKSKYLNTRSVLKSTIRGLLALHKTMMNDHDYILKFASLMQTLKLNRKAEPCSYLEKMISSLATLMSEPLAKKPVRVAN